MVTLKRLITTIVLTATCSVATAQDFSNIEFVENKGQWDSRVKFKGEINAGAVFIRSSGFTILQHNPHDYAALQSELHGHKHPVHLIRAEDKVYSFACLGCRFRRGFSLYAVVPDKIISSYNNYFIGNDPSKWAGGCRIYQAITLKNVYPNVDIRYYTYNGALKYDIVAKPGADISKIALRYKGTEQITGKK